MIENKENIIVSNPFQLALSFIEFCQKFENTAKLAIVKQLLKVAALIRVKIHEKLLAQNKNNKNYSLAISN
ncbi:MAG TPA: hypothetical protein PK252_10395 [Bacteroidales bacterium]|nr:hypothetical protein [Bacteroidales bacterium]